MIDNGEKISYNIANIIIKHIEGYKYMKYWFEERDFLG